MALTNNSSSEMSLDSDLGVTLMRLRRALYREMELAYQAIDVTPEQVAILEIIDAVGIATILDIEKKLLREPNTILGLINRMEEKGLIRKGKDLKNRNRITMAATKKGQGIASKAALISAQMKPFSILSETDKLQMLSNLEMVLRGALTRLEKEDEFEYKR